jgi:SulP family sulfate permease
MVSLFRLLLGGLLIGAMAVVFAISFAAFIYNDQLSAHLDQAIGLTLIGAAIMAMVGGVLFSFRGTLIHPQDVTAVLLAGAATRVAGAAPDPTTALATMILLVAVAGCLAGAATALLGIARLGHVFRFVPYPVLGGFLAATGYLLVVGAIGMIMGHGVTFWEPGAALSAANVLRWAPWILAGAMIAALTRATGSDLALPVGVLGTGGLFFAWLWISGTGLDGAREAGQLLGPFSSDGFLGRFDPGLLLAADWGVIRQELPVLLAVVGMAVLGSFLNLRGIELSTGLALRLDNDLKATGLANVAGAMSGGLVGYASFAETMLGWRLGMLGMTMPLAVALTSVAAAFLGADVLSLVPVGLLASVVAFLGWDLLYTWLWLERRKLPRREFAVVVLILLTTILVGFLEALLVGLLTSMLLFVLSYTQLGILRSRTTLAGRRSRIERPMPDMEYLTREGDRVVILELTGYLFFGSATRLQTLVEREVRQARPRPDRIVADFRHVRDIDASAIITLRQTVESCMAEGITVAVSGMPRSVRRKIRRYSAEDMLRIPMFDRLDTALDSIEQELLAARPSPAAGNDPGAALLHDVSRALEAHDLADCLQADELPAGTILMHQGEPAEEVVFLLRGTAFAYVTRPDGRRTTIARFVPGAIIGEIGFYGGMDRTATVEASGPVRVLRVNPAALAARGNVPNEALMAIHQTSARYMAQRLAHYTRLALDEDR